MAEHLKPIIEALIFASPEPLPEKTLLKLLEGEPKEDVEAALALLKQDYERPGGLQLVEVAGGYQIVTRPELHEYVRRLFHERTSQKLSVQALETLAVIAYKQPITAPEITEIRGSNASGVLNTLIGRKLIKIVGRKAVVGRPFMYATTRDFLDKFGLNDISDLPKVEDLADVLGFDPPSLDSEPTATPLAFDFDDSADAGSMESAATEEAGAESAAAEEQTVSEDAGVEEATVEDAPAEEASVEETIVEETIDEEGDTTDRENLVRDGEPSS
jgi:segregation and condensation protein B